MAMIIVMSYILYNFNKVGRLSIVGLIN